MASTQAQQAENLHYRALKILQDTPDISQRELAAQLGVNHGKVNYCLKALAGKGLVKLHNVGQSKNPWRCA